MQQRTRACRVLLYQTLTLQLSLIIVHVITNYKSTAVLLVGGAGDTVRSGSDWILRSYISDAKALGRVGKNSSLLHRLLM